MPIAPDDLPRSPTGRVPQWALDEATRVGAAHPAEPPVRRSDAPPLPRSPVRRRRMWPVVTVVVGTALVASWWSTHGTSGLPPVIAGVLDALPGPQPLVGGRDVPPPSADVAALADAAYLSEEGREIFYSTEPEVLGAAEFAGRCTAGHAAQLLVPSLAQPLVHGEAVGCYDGSSIVVYAPADPRLAGFVVETAAHEALHAAWEELTPAEQDALVPLLEAEVATVPADAEIHAQIAGSVGAVEANRPTELFAYVGTQLWREGGLAPQLESAYARFVADRAALVAVHAGWQGMLDGMSAEVQAASTALNTQLSTNAQSRAQLDADRSSVAYYDASYREKVAEVDAMSADERQRLRLSWVWWDGTDLPMATASTTLATAAGLLARDATDLAAREVALTAAETVAATERTRVDALLADLQALQAQLLPTPAAG